MHEGLLFGEEKSKAFCSEVNEGVVTEGPAATVVGLPEGAPEENVKDPKEGTSLAKEELGNLEKVWPWESSSDLVTNDEKEENLKAEGVEVCCSILGHKT